MRAALEDAFADLDDLIGLTSEWDEPFREDVLRMSLLRAPNPLATSCQKKLAAANATIASLQTQVADLGNQLSAERALSAALAEQLAEADQVIADQAVEIADQAAQLIEAREAVDDLSAAYEAAVSERDALQIALDECLESPPPPPPPPPPGGPVLGAWQPVVLANGSEWTTPDGSRPPAPHAYGGIDRGQLVWRTPIGPDTAVFNFRPRKKPEGAPVHLFQGGGTACAICGWPASHQNHDDAVTKVLTGQYDALIDEAAATVRSAGRRLIGTVWHEPLMSAELFPGQVVADWARVFAYVANRFDAAGADADWYSCAFSSQYADGTAELMHTPELTAVLTGVGADMYFQFADPLPGDANRAWKAIADFRSDLPHVIFETGLWSDPARQPAWFAALDAWYKSHPSWIGLFGFFRLGDGANQDGRLTPEGRAAWESMIADPFYSRSLG